MTMEKISRSGYINHTMLGLKVTMGRKAAGLEPISLRGFTIRSLKIQRVVEDGRSYRCVCNKCRGHKYLNPETDWVRDDINGRGYVCFACQGKGSFGLPQPEIYRDAVGLWILDAHLRDAYPQIQRLMTSELSCESIELPYFKPTKELWSMMMVRSLEGMDAVQPDDELFERLFPVWERASHLGD
jgi:hypothetical protein